MLRSLNSVFEPFTSVLYSHFTLSYLVDELSFVLSVFLIELFRFVTLFVLADYPHVYTTTRRLQIA